MAGSDGGSARTSGTNIPIWLVGWVAITVPVVMWDAAYVLMRPYSETSAIWKPYQLYAEVDLTYGKSGNAHSEAWCLSQTMMNVVEVLLQCYALLRIAMTGRTDRCAAVTLLVASVGTLWKTLLYFLIEHNSNWANVGHNDLHTLITLYVIPNGLWIVFPALATYVLSHQLSSAGDKPKTA